MRRKRMGIITIEPGGRFSSLSKTKHIAVLPGDGIGTEVINEAIKVLKRIESLFGYTFVFNEALIGGAAIDAAGEPLPAETLKLCEQADAVLLGAVGGPKWDQNPGDMRPEAGLLKLRKALALYANLRPAKAHSQLIGNSALKTDVVQGVDLIVVRELTGGLYFGEKRRDVTPDGEAAVDTLIYHEHEVERIVRQAFDIARVRRKHVTSVDKANVLESSRLWREVAERVARDYPDVTLAHMLVDSCAMQLVHRPAQFDVIVTENMFGDILSDEAAILTGSIGMLPSASLGKGNKGLYEPVHGTAPDIAGQGKANPMAAILSAAMMMKYSFGDDAASTAIEQAVSHVLDAGYRTGDLADTGKTVISTSEYGDKIVAHLNR